MIEHLSDFPGNVVAFACRGRDKSDYETVLSRGRGGDQAA